MGDASSGFDLLSLYKSNLISRDRLFQKLKHLSVEQLIFDVNPSLLSENQSVQQDFYLLLIDKVQTSIQYVKAANFFKETANDGWVELLRKKAKI